jgi:hypothetical protein
MVNQALASLMLFLTIVSALGLGVFSGYAVVLGLFRLIAPHQQQPVVPAAAPGRMRLAAVNTDTSGD